MRVCRVVLDIAQQVMHVFAGNTLFEQGFADRRFRALEPIADVRHADAQHRRDASERLQIADAQLDDEPIVGRQPPQGVTQGGLVAFVEGRRTFARRKLSIGIRQPELVGHA